MRRTSVEMIFPLALLAAIFTGNAAARAQGRRQGPPPGQGEQQGGPGMQGQQGPGQDGPPGGFQGKGEQMIERLSRRLGLSVDQEQKLKDFAESRIKPLMKETMKLHREAARAAMHTGPSKSDAIHQQFLAKEADLYKAQVEMGNLLRGMLTPDQKKKLEEGETKMRERRGPGGPPEGPEREDD